MRVKMKTTTNWQGKLRRPGDILTVDDSVAKRWERNKIAVIVEDKKGKKGNPDDGLESLSIEELRTMAEDRGITPGNMKRDDLIAAIRG